MIRSTCRVPLRAGTNFSMPSVNSVSPTLSLLLIAENASVALELGHQLALRLPMGAEALRRAQVDQQHHRHLALFAEELDEWPAGAGGHVPVDRPHIVADLVRPDLFELDAAAFERGVPLAGEQLVDDVPRVDLDAANLLDDFAGEHGLEFAADRVIRNERQASQRRGRRREFCEARRRSHVAEHAEPAACDVTDVCRRLASITAPGSHRESCESRRRKSSPRPRLRR